MLVQDSKLLGGFTQFCVIDSLSASNLCQVEQINQNNVPDNRKCPQNIKFFLTEGLFEIRDNQCKGSQLHLT